MIDPFDPGKKKEDEIKLLRMLGHPARLEILQILRIDEECVCHLEAILGLRQAYLSQQLAVLRNAGMIVDRRDGWNVYYRIADLRLIPVLDALANATGAARSTGQGRAVGEHCPCPKCSLVRENAE